MSTVRIKGDTSGYVDLAAGATGGNLTVGNGTNNTVYIDNANGRVGINNSAPASTLHLGTGYSVFQMGANDSTGFHWAKDTSALNLYTGVVGSGSRTFGIDTSGRVTMPYQPSFYAYGNTGTPSVGNPFIFPNIQHNTGNHYNSSTGIFTAPIEGVYQFNFFVMGDSTDNRFMVRLSINGGNDAQASSSSNANQYDTATLSMSFKLSANDTVAARYHGNKNAYDTAQIHNGFSGYLVG